MKKTGYTAIVRSIRYRGAALLTAAALIATPSLVSACLALCLPGVAHHGGARPTADVVSAPEGPGEHDHGSAHADPPADHHGGNATRGEGAFARDEAPAYMAAPSTPDHACCVDRDAAPMASLAAARSVTPPPAAVVPPPAPLVLTAMARAYVPGTGPPAEPPRLLRPSLVLRI